MRGEAGWLMPNRFLGKSMDLLGNGRSKASGHESDQTLNQPAGINMSMKFGQQATLLGAGEKGQVQGPVVEVDAPE
jgi:hypothetical protein